MDEFSNRVILITGGASGLGKAAAWGFGRRGARIFLADRNEGAATAAAAEMKLEGVNAEPLGVDVSSGTSVSTAVKNAVIDAGRIDVLLHCAGIARGDHQMGPDGWLPMEEVSEEDWNQVVGVDLTGTFLVNREVGRIMIGQSRGRIINVASISGMVANMGLAGLGPYSAAKGGVIALTRVLAMEWAQHGVTVNSISPGYMATEMGMRSQRFPEFRRIQIEQTPAGRLGDPGEFAAAALYLASDAASYVTGHNLVIDGGYTVW